MSEDVNRAGFVRRFSVNVPVAEILRRAAEAGIALTAADVHSTRYYERKKLARSKAKGGMVESEKALPSSLEEQTRPDPPIAPSGTAIVLRRAEPKRLAPEEIRTFVKRVGIVRVLAVIEQIQTEIENMRFDDMDLLVKKTPPNE